jgi:CBS domain-containing protein
MSPRAAWRLEGLGFEQVFDYAPGKVDWFASGLPREGDEVEVAAIGEASRSDVPTCGPMERVSEVWERVREADWKTCVVVNDDRVVLGLLREKELTADLEAHAEGVMRLGPTTFRPDVPVEEMVERMRKRGVYTTLVTTPDGKLVGQFHREEAES